jgi:DNA-binding CsgD family transcriptional regulator
MSNRIQCDMLISINTVRTHVRHLYEKLSASRRDQVVARASMLGLLENSRPMDYGS